jgi:selenocysteine-specific elongation factor
VAAGDDLEILPGGRAVRVREVQVHDRSAERAFAGQRVALNLSGVERDGVRRGDCVVARGSATASDRFDAAIEIRPSARKAVSSHAPVRVYVGTRDAAGKVIWLDGVETVAPRSRGYAQIVLEEPAAVFARDRFILRDAASLRTLGGGMVLLPRAARHTRSEGALGPLLQVLESGDGKERITALVRATRTLGVPIADVAVALDQDQRQTEESVAGDSRLVTFPLGQPGVLVADRAGYDAFVEELLTETAAFHRDHPSSPGIDLERLRAAASHAVDSRLLRYAVDDLVARGCLHRQGSIVALPGHRVSMNDADEMLARRILEAIRTAANMPPTTKDLADRFALEPRRLAEILSVLGERGATVKVSTDLVFAREAIDEIEHRLRGHLGRAPTITAAEFRDLIDASRKYSIPLLDYFDRSGVTIRSGDFRRLR